jgi:EmrB/QacA subfamily drug resistance transporter
MEMKMNFADVKKAGPGAPQAGATGTEHTARAPWLALSVLALAQFLVVLDASIVNIALPSIGTGLGLPAELLAWVITAYVLPFGGLLLLGGRLADRYGHRRVFLLGVGGFIAASLAAALSPDGMILLGARAVQGASAALLAPAALALLMRLFPSPADRAKALGIWGAVAGLGSAAGVLLGGVLTARFGWPSIFLINVPVGLLVIGTLPRLVGKDRTGARLPLDLPGAATITAATVLIVAALSLVLEFGFFAPLTLGLATAGLVLFGLFVVIEKRSVAPLVDFSILGKGGVRLGNIAMLLVGAVTVGLFFILSLQMQNVWAFDALGAGLSQLPLALALVATAGMLPPVIARFGSKRVLALSLPVLALGLGWLALAPVGADFLLHLVGPSIVIGIGLGGAFIATTELAVQGVSEVDSGLASGLVNTSQQIGGALGLALIFTLAMARTASLAPQLDSLAALNGGYQAAYLAAALAALLGAAIVSLTKTR